MTERVIGKYKIVPGFGPGRYLVYKSLGPWPLANWSWITFFEGTEARCRDYIRWASRIDAGDVHLVDHVNGWTAPRLGGEDSEWRIKPHEAVHIPKTLGYDVKPALERYPERINDVSDYSGRLLIAFAAIIVFVICGFLYHSM